MSDTTVREATRDDLPAILEIYNDAILNTTAVYSSEVHSLEMRREWFEARVRDGYPVFVSHAGSSITGFCSYGAFRVWPAYQFTVEGSVYVHPDHRGRGVGKALIPPLLDHARRAGKHAFIAGIDSSNTASIRLHQGFGFRQVAHFREVGWKFDRWLDLLFFELILNQP